MRIHVHKLMAKRCVVLIAQLCQTLCNPHGALQAPLSMKFSRQAYWSGLPFPSLGDLSHPGVKARSPAKQADSLLTELEGLPPKIRQLNLKNGQKI